MGVKSDKKFVSLAVSMAQDNMFLRQMVKEMTDFIIENGVLNFSTERRQQEAMVKNYFKSIALEKLEIKGYHMGVNTPWGRDAAKLDKVNAFRPLEEDDIDEDSDDILEYEQED
ncbi:MAG: hypothetical protein J6J36_02800 [Clostridia bacterium]|nr:hypothetical protein [Clostridia bacterium]